MISKILTGDDKAKELGLRTLREMLQRMAAEHNKPFTGKVTKKSHVYARVDFGRWIADCECGGASYAEPTDPIFYCLGCGNESSQGNFRRIIFPENMDEIEAELMRREVRERPGLGPCDTALSAISVLPGLPRSWLPGESVDTLRIQREGVAHGT